MTLCVYCTRTGITKQIAEQIAKTVGGDTLFISNGKNYDGTWGFVRAAVVGLKRSFPALAPFTPEHPLSSYDRVIVCAPIWSENVCPIARSFLKRYGDELTGKVYYVVTHMSDIGYDKKIVWLDAVLGRLSDGYLSVQTKDHDYAADVAAFCETL